MNDFDDKLGIDLDNDNESGEGGIGTISNEPKTLSEKIKGFKKERLLKELKRKNPRKVTTPLKPLMQL